MRKPLVRLVLSALAAASVACSDPYGEIKADLSPSEVALFDLGARAVNPCWSCHDVTGDGINIGPPLGSVFGRQAGTADGYAYSAALQRSGVVWTESSLSAFLSNVSGSIPGNRMVSPSVQNPEQLRAMVFFLRQVARAKSRSR